MGAEKCARAPSAGKVSFGVTPPVGEQTGQVGAGLLADGASQGAILIVVRHLEWTLPSDAAFRVGRGFVTSRPCNVKKVIGGEVELVSISYLLERVRTSIISCGNFPQFFCRPSTYSRHIYFPHVFSGIGSSFEIQICVTANANAVN